MPAPLHGKTIIITGANGALAQSLIPTLTQAGASLTLVTHHPTTTGNHATIQADLTDPQQAQQLRQVPAHALIHTAGAFSMQAAQHATPQDLHHLLTANFHTLFHATQAVLPHMLHQHEGTIIGISAAQAARGAGPKAALYTAAKSAVASYLKSLDAELREQGVRASVIYPMGAIDTPSNRANGMPPEGMIDPQDLAESVLHVLTRSKRGHVDEVRVQGAK